MENTNKTMQKLKNNKLMELTLDDIKEIQLCILEMIKDLNDFFDKNNIVYYLGGGSALGAIRHQGFIPWDEDMDINMPRKNCEKLVELFKINKEINCSNYSHKIY